MRAERQRREGRLEEQPARPPLVHVPALHDAVPAAYLVVEQPADPAGRLDVEMPPGVTVDPVAQQQLGRADRAPGKHDRARVHARTTRRDAGRAPAAREDFRDTHPGSVSGFVQCISLWRARRLAFHGARRLSRL